MERFPVFKMFDWSVSQTHDLNLWLQNSSKYASNLTLLPRLQKDLTTFCSEDDYEELKTSVSPKSFHISLAAFDYFSL